MVIRESVLSLFGDDTIRTEYDSVLNVYLKKHIGNNVYITVIQVISNNIFSQL